MGMPRSSAILMNMVVGRKHKQFLNDRILLEETLLPFLNACTDYSFMPVTYKDESMTMFIILN